MVCHRVLNASKFLPDNDSSVAAFSESYITLDFRNNISRLTLRIDSFGLFPKEPSKSFENFLEERVVFWCSHRSSRYQSHRACSPKIKCSSMMEIVCWRKSENVDALVLKERFSENPNSHFVFSWSFKIFFFRLY